MSDASPENSGGPGQATLTGRKVLVGVSGGIACYKATALVSRLVQAGAAVRVIMTEAATRFVTPLTFQALSGQSVLTSIWEADDRPDSQHIGLAKWCDAFVIAPASADVIAKIAHGLTDDLISLTACALPRTPGSARTTPVLLAPAMNANMWENPITQRNLATLRDVLGWQTVGPETGWQACRTAGAGRMSEPEAIFEAVKKFLV
jgi:phosphopantothenoylcysteine synthetase/decarboxylase